MEFHRLKEVFMEYEFDKLVGKTLKKIEAKEYYIAFTDTDNVRYKLFHQQDCCEHVYVESITGDLSDLLDAPILLAEEVSNNDPIEGTSADPEESFTWTFYKLATIKGYVDIRWFGTSNGCYSESVSFGRIKPND